MTGPNTLPFSPAATEARKVLVSEEWQLRADAILAEGAKPHATQYGESVSVEMRVTRRIADERMRIRAEQVGQDFDLGEFGRIDVAAHRYLGAAGVLGEALQS